MPTAARHPCGPAIHPSANIDDRAVIHPTVTIGPRCFIEGPVTIGPHTTLIADVSLKGPLTLGDHNLLAERVCIGYEPQDRKFDPAVSGSGTIIGDRNRFAPGVTIHRATGPTPTTIGSDNAFETDSHAGHDVRIADHCTLGPGALLAGHVTLESGVVLDRQACVHQFCRVGRLARLLERTGVPQDVPPFCIAPHRGICGLNLEALTAAGLAEHIPDLQRAFDLIYHSGLILAHAEQRIQTNLSHDPLCLELARFLATSKRGICELAPG